MRRLRLRLDRSGLVWVGAALLFGLLWLAHRERASSVPVPSVAVPQPSTAPAPREAPPVVLYLPEAGDVPPPEVSPPEAPVVASRSGRCPPEMVDVGGRVCVDRYEAVLEDPATHRRLSPFYHPSPARARAAFEQWSRQRAAAATGLGRSLAIPAPPAWQLTGPYEVAAIVRAGELPHGYLDGLAAERACQRAGKRLCTESEWVFACRGELDRPFPYGDQYEPGRCNVFREGHPAAELHGDASRGHLDPRLNTVAVGGRPLLRPTGTTAGCKSVWGDDAIYDMVGNLDEWIEDPEGAFLGGFFSRATRAGCAARISSHPREYSDYSLGVRCCREP